MKTFLTHFSVIIAAAFIATGCGVDSLTSQEIPKGAVCRVGDGSVSEALYKATIKAADKKQHPALLGQLIANEIVALEAEEKYGEVKDKEVTKRLDAMKKTAFNGDDKEFKKLLKAQGLTEAAVKEQLKRQMAMEKAMAELAGKEPSEKQMAAYFKKNKQAFTIPTSRQVQMIILKDKAAAEKALAQVNGGADFAKLAKKLSIDPNAKSTGGLTTINQGQVVPELEKPVFKTPKGDAVLVKSPYGWHVLMPTSDVVKGKSPKFENVKADIALRMKNEKQGEAFSKWREKTVKGFDKEDIDCGKVKFTL